MTSGAGEDLRTTRNSGGVQSIERVFELLETMADAGGVIGLSQLASQSGLPLPTIHRLVRTLVDLGYVRQEPSREYALGPRLVRLGDISSGLLTRWAIPYLQKVVDVLGESTNLAILDGDQIMYVAQAPGSHSMRMFTEVGRRAQVHCTAVGKAMLAQLPAEKVDGILRRSGMPAMTEHTITDRAAVRPGTGADPRAWLRHRRGRAGARRTVRGRRAAQQLHPRRDLDLRAADPDDRHAHPERRPAADRHGERPRRGA